MWWKVILLIVFGLAVAMAVAVLYGKYRWETGTRALRGRIEAARVAIEPRVFDSRELESLPAPVQRYFLSVLSEGQPMVSAVYLEHTGTFNMRETAEHWKPFHSTQRVITRRPGFDWDGRIAMMPGLTVHVHDAYVAGEGILQASLFGLVPLVNLRGMREMARGELMRFLAEAAWYPTALLPSQGVRWEAVDDGSARAMLKDGDLELTLLFRFDENGLIEAIHSQARPRIVRGEVVPTPWRGRFWNYATRNGMRVPLEGEVAWILPEGEKPYWRGRITKLSYEFAQ